MKAAALLMGIACASAIAAGWKIREGKDGATELYTPYGVKEVVGELAPTGTASYRVEIPLEDFKPEPTPDSEKKSAGEEKHQRWETIIEKEITKTVPGEGNTCTNCDKREPASVPPRVIVEYDDSDRYVVEANRLYNRGKFYDATNVVEELLRKKPDHVRGWVMKGSLMHVQGHKELAKAAYQTAFKLDPNNEEIKKLVEKYYK
jgi:tetratricopeptide (TPR) repeat protein